MQIFALLFCRIFAAFPMFLVFANGFVFSRLHLCNLLIYILICVIKNRGIPTARIFFRVSIHFHSSEVENSRDCYESIIV